MTLVIDPAVATARRKAISSAPLLKTFIKVTIITLLLYSSFPRDFYFVVLLILVHCFNFHKVLIGKYLYPYGEAMEQTIRGWALNKF